jgi:hypothetical protein
MVERATKLSTESVKISSRLFMIVSKYFINPCISGLMGFATMFTVVIIVELLNFIAGINKNFIININDVTFSSLGFICFFLISILSNFKKD